ncbi:MAG: hypothetical protein COA50_13045 [Flavobacteriaceae bacterium]|nr:MAG: hypothetical protein COA50_13045 [Flavobacteriaceae bacterium]
MQRYVFFFIALTALLFWGSCRKNFDYQTSTGNLEFSKDTVYLDTVFTTIGSSTRTLKVYNKSNTDIQIPSIRLASGQNSSYRLNVDGMAGKEFENIPIFAKDSIFIFIESTFDIAPTNEKEFLYTDAIQFSSSGNMQEVQLVTLIKDAIFLFPKTLSDGSKETFVLGMDDEGNEIAVEGFIIEDTQLNFTNEKPYVIYGYAVVQEDKTLSINAGARVYFHDNSGIIVPSKASINVMGALSSNQEELENEVVFEGDRLEPEFENIAGQWGTIWLTYGSINNQINYLTIKNASVGLFVEGDGLLDNPTLTIKNTQIHNSSNFNLWGKTASIIGENIVLGSAGASSLYCSLGGNYVFTHCTIANYWTNGFRNATALFIDNFIETDLDNISKDLTQADFINCIIDGNSRHELALSKTDASLFNYSFKNCAITFNETELQFLDPSLYNFNDPIWYSDVLLNVDLDFYNAQKNDFRIGAASEIIGRAAVENSVTVPFDILGKSRILVPEIGAYELDLQN